MQDYMPQLIRIMPDYGGEYVFDEDGGVTRLTLVLKNMPILKGSLRSNGVFGTDGFSCQPLIDPINGR